MATTSTTVTLDRGLVERLIVELDGIAHFDSLRSGRCETDLMKRLYNVTGELGYAAFGEQSDELKDRSFDRGIQRGEEIVRDLLHRGRDDA